ncbi:hypothetical protein QTP70_015890, partial [Hemibagrus guttatus]
MFALDTQKLQGKYIELQRSLHPDKFSQKSQTEQRYSEEQSALINKAYRTLQKPLTRSVYMLQLRGVELDEGTDSAADPALLLKVMEVNEKLAETQSLDEVNAVGQEVQVTLKNLTEQMNTSLHKGILLIFLFTSCKFEIGRYTRLRRPAVSQRDPGPNEILCKSGRESKGETEGEHV